MIYQKHYIIFLTTVVWLYMKVSTVLSVTILIVFMIPGVGLSGFFHVEPAKENHGYNNPSFKQDEKILLQGAPPEDPIFNGSLPSIPEDLSKILPDIAMPFRLSYNYAVQYRFVNVISSVSDVGFYDGDRRLWYGRHGDLDHDRSERLNIENGNLSVWVTLHGPLNGEVRIEIRRDIVKSFDDKVFEFTTDRISLEQGEMVRIKTDALFQVDGYNDYDFGDGFRNLRKYFVIIRVHRPAGNDIVFGNGDSDFYSGELSMLDPYDGRDQDGDGLTDGEEEERRENPLDYSSPVSEDTDNDGLLSDKVELDYGLSPSNNDTDGDGLSDRWEYRFRDKLGVDPKEYAEKDFLNSDVDNDNLTVAQEAAFGSDPTSPVNHPDDLSPPKNTTDWEELMEYTATLINEKDTLSFPLLSVITFAVAVTIAALFHVRKKRKLSYI